MGLTFFLDKSIQLADEQDGVYTTHKYLSGLWSDGQVLQVNTIYQGR